MIESSIVDWVDLGDSMQSLEVYGRKNILQIFKFMHTLLNHKYHSIYFYIILKFFFFLQIIMINLTNLNMYNEIIIPNQNFYDSNANTFNSSDVSTTTNKIIDFDYTIKILNYVSTSVLFVQEIITNAQQYKYSLLINSTITVISIICLIYIIISLKYNKLSVKFPIIIFNLINIFILEYFIGPSIQISLLTFKCTGGIHDILKTQCYTDIFHIFYSVISFINLLYFTFMSIILSIFFYEIGSITEIKVDNRINTNFEFYSNVSKISFFITAYFLKFYSNNNNSYRIIFELYILSTCSFYSYYYYMYMLHYNETIDSFNQFGWVYVTWFSFIIFLKSILTLNETSVFIICGWVILSLIFKMIAKLKVEYLLTDLNIFESKSLKEIILYNVKVFSLINTQSFNYKILLIGIIKKFEDSMSSNPNMLDKYRKLTSNFHLKKKYNSESALSLLAKIYIIYDHYLEKSNFKIDILFNFCYFLANRLKNSTYAVYLLSKIKSKTFKEMYLKYLLMEDFKSSMINRLMKNTNRESFKRIQLGSAILFNIYCQIFKNKIYEITCNQIEYFDHMKNNIITNKTTEKFLSHGEEIIRLKRETIRLWEKIIELNPFNEECFRDLKLYVIDILQDEILLKSETKKINSLRSSKYSEKNNAYYYLFNPLNSILLVDGYSTFGKVLYYTQNFPALFDFSGKELLNMTIDDLCPQVIKEFHREIIFIGIQYTNLGVIFSQQRDLLMRGKSGNLHWIKIFIKFVPNLSHGVIYMLDISKVTDKIFNILIDKNFKITAFTDSFNQGMHGSEVEGYILDRSCVNSYLAILIPQILLDMEYNENSGFYFSKDNYDLKGTFYNVAPHRYLNEKVEKVLANIRTNGKLIFLKNNLEENEFQELIHEIETKSVTKQSVFYKIIPRIFSNGRHRYYKVILSNDFISLGNDGSSEDDGKNEKDKLENYDQRMEKKKETEKKKVKEGETNENKDDLNGRIFEEIKPPFYGVSGIRENNSNMNVKARDKGINLKDMNMGMFQNGQKLIKIKLNYNSSEEEEKKKLMEENENKKNFEADLNNLEKQKEENSFGSKSTLSVNSVASSRFNKLKNGILEQKEIVSIKHMKLLSVFFLICMIVLVLFASNYSNEKFSNLNNYILENLFFNHSKISVSCVYFSTLNIKLIKQGAFQTKLCKNLNCKLFYRNLLDYCLTDIKVEKQNSNKFFDDFNKILFSQKEIELNIENQNEKNKISINVENNLNLIISYGLNLEAGLDEYFQNLQSNYDVITENILDQSLQFILDENLKGFNEAEKLANLEKRYLTPINPILIIEVISFSILLIFFIIFISQIYLLESLYLKKLIYFKNPPFDSYLKSLEELKKKLRSDNGEDELKNEISAADINVSEVKGNIRMGTKKNIENEDSTGKKFTKRGKKTENRESDNEDDQKGHGKKNIKIKKNKERTRKKSRDFRIFKVNIMGRYFLKENISFFFKVILIMLLSASYYLLVNIIDQKNINQILEFDYTYNAVEGVYKESFMIYLNLKIELYKYIEYELKKKKVVETFNSNNYILSSLIKNDTNKFTVWFENKPYYDPDSLLNSNFYSMNIPFQIDSPKIGTMLITLTNKDMSTAPTNIINLNILYNGNACSILFDYDTQKDDFDLCSNFWSSILVKGLEQSITQMSVIITSVIDDFKSLNFHSKTFLQFISEGSAFDTLEKFVQIYLLNGYMITVKIFRELTNSNLEMIFIIYKYITIGYIIFSFFLFGFLFYLIHSSKRMFNTFMNFIGIVPIVYILEDTEFYKEILKLEVYM